MIRPNGAAPIGIDLASQGCSVFGKHQSRLKTARQGENSMTMRRLALAAAACGAAFILHPAAARADEASCRALMAKGLFADTTVTSADMVGQTPTAGGVAYCEVKGVISPVPGSKIGVVYRLPENWNGRVLGIGGGGWAGNVTLEAAQQGLKKGYATLQTNGGHDNLAAFDTSWAKDNPVAVTDFSHRAVHTMTVVGKTVVGRYYAKPLALAVFEGCSTGGRMGLMEAQRYPSDYNAIIAGAPVFSLQVQTSGLVRRRLFTTDKTALSDAQVARVNQAVLDSCDAADGLKDGIVTDPRACRWDPSALQCKPGQAADSCLTAEQAGALRRAYATVRTTDGKVAFYGLSRSGELGWGTFIALRPALAEPGGVRSGGLGDLRAFIYGDAAYDEAKFNPETDTGKVRSTPFAKEYEAADPDVRPFLSSGGKLLLYHGFDDPAPSPYATIAYYEDVKRVTGADSAVALFVAPGMYHCRGGPGASNFDMLSAMEGWVDQGKAPAVIPASNPTAGFTRPLCAWPDLAFYKGEGDPKDAASFACRATGTRTASAAR
jgi:feruloyl esterase